jgi:hypothetical protein
MKSTIIVAAVCLLFATLPAQANSILVTGTLANPQSSSAYEFTLAGAANVNFQTLSFGGGTSVTGPVIPAGGFDPFISLFLGTGPTATIVMSGGNPAADAAILGNNAGACGPANMVSIGMGPGSSICGDAQMSLLLGAGTYTLLLTDGLYEPNAVVAGGTTIADGFFDLTGGASMFQTCNTLPDGTTPCINPNGNFAFDVTTTPVVSHVPEPATLSLLGSGLAVLAGLTRRRSRRQALPKF